MQKIFNSLNLIAILILFVGLTLSFASRYGVPNTMPIPILNYISAFFLGTVILLLPNFLQKKFRKNDWLTNEAFFSVFTILILGLLGYNQILSTIYYQYFITILGLFLIAEYLFNFSFKKINLWIVFSGFITAFYFYLLCYSSQALTPLYDIQLFIKKFYQDTIFHISISNMITNYGIPSTGLDGTPYVSYHFGTHLLFGALKRFTGDNIFFFYHIVYAPIFIGLFYKFFVEFSLLISEKIQKKMSIYVFNVLLILMSYSNLIIMKNSNIFNHQSTLVSFIFLFLLGIIFTKGYTKKITTSFIANLFAIALMITIFKISTGLVAISIICYLILRKNFTIKNITNLAFFGIIFLAIFYEIMFGFSKTFIHNEKASGLDAFISSSKDFYSTFLGIFVAIIFLFFFKKASSIKEMLLKKEILIPEILILSNFIGIILLIIVIRDGTNFLHLEFLLSIPILASFFSIINTEKIKFKYILSNFVIILLTLASYSEYKKSISQNLWLRERAITLDRSENILKLFFETYEKENSIKKNEAIFIDERENWFYDNKGNNYFLGPAITGNPLIFGIKNKRDFSREGWGFSYYSYDAHHTLEDAVKKSKKLGYDNLIVVTYKKNKFIETQIKLK